MAVSEALKAARARITELEGALAKEVAGQNDAMALVMNHEAHIARLNARIADLSANEYAARLVWRGITTACPKCHGSGVYLYGTTATWVGGIGGAAMTNGVCDKCWGSGDADRPGANLAKLQRRLAHDEPLDTVTIGQRDAAEAAKERLTIALQRLLRAIDKRPEAMTSGHRNAEHFDSETWPDAVNYARAVCDKYRGSGDANGPSVNLRRPRSIDKQPSANPPPQYTDAELKEIATVGTFRAHPDITTKLLASALLTARASIRKLEHQRADDEIGDLATIDQRDAAEEAADALALKVACLCDDDVGEHSNANDPWANALDMLEPATQSITTWHPADQPPTGPARDVLLHFEGQDRPGTGYYARKQRTEGWRVLTSPYKPGQARGDIIAWAELPATRKGHQ